MPRPKHRCHWPGCDAIVPASLWGCRAHWFRLPPGIRRRLTAAYRPGQEQDKRPTRDYIQAAKDARTWALQQKPDPCGKIAYATRHQAQRTGSRLGRNLRVYRCTACNAYHLTHKVQLAAVR